MEFEFKKIEWLQGYLKGIGAVSTVYGRDINADFILQGLESEGTPHETIIKLNRDWDGKYLENIKYKITPIKLGSTGLQSQIDEAMKSFQFDILNDVSNVSNQSYNFLKKTIETSHTDKIDYLSKSFLGCLKHHIDKDSQYFHFLLESYEKKKDTPSQYGFGNIGEEFLIYGSRRSFYIGLLLPD